MKIVETDNYNGNYPDETFVTLPSMCEEHAKRISNVINECLCSSEEERRFWKVVKDNYKLIGEFIS